MKHYLRMTYSVILILMLTFMAACSNGKTTESAKSDETISIISEDDGPLSKYAVPVTVRTVMNDVGKDFLSEGDTLENNVWTRGYEEELNIKLTFDWIVEAANASSKLNVTLTGGDIPDIFAVGHTQFKQLLEAGKITDLTEVFDKYASQQLKSFYSMGGDGLKPVRHEDKLYGLTDYSGSVDTAPMVYIRSDWMENLQLKPPKTIDDLIMIATAFTEQDPDKNNIKDTYGFQFNKDLDGGWTMKMNGFANAYGAFPRIWVKDDKEQLVYGSIQPEMKVALEKLQQLYKQGVIDQEFGTKDVNKAAESIMAGKAGIFFGPLASPFAIGTMMQDETIDWMAYPIPSETGEPTVVPSEIQNATVFVVRKDFAHPEALIKLLNFAVEKLYGQSAEQEAGKYLGDGGQGFQVTPFKMLQPNKNVLIYENVVNALQSGDTSNLNREEWSNYEFIQAYRSGTDRSKWVYERIFGPESTIAVVKYYMDNDLLKLNQFSAPPTTTMATKKATLERLELETFSKIIYGAASIDEFDKFVMDWKKLGGSQMTEEVNEQR
ncbi:extracellular solute-binding protein [Paenibacillus yanchengensis]|uniref:Extracellular solute-binding protein n=1 Tax=Paenibacillus yanchengensis TaxID=2035833 RepID=A0ABW4YQM9_9BACL